MCRLKTLDAIHSKNNQRFKGFTKGIQGSSLLDNIQFVCDRKGIINYKVAAFNMWTKKPGLWEALIHKDKLKSPYIK